MCSLKVTGWPVWAWARGTAVKQASSSSNEEKQCFMKQRFWIYDL
jgi:hypothetical protein